MGIDPYDIKILVACERSGIVRRAFSARGFDAWSVDLQASPDGSNHHIIGDIRDHLNDGWDALIVAHPPCTRLCNSGVRWLSVAPGNPPEEVTAQEAEDWPGMGEAARMRIMWRLLDEGAALFSDCWTADIPCIAVENPVMHHFAKERIRGYQPFAQSVQPWQFGDDPAGPDNVKKRTCWWLRGLPKLSPTGTLDGSTARADIHLASPGKNRKDRRSQFFPGMAAAIADQWGGEILRNRSINIHKLG